MAADPPADIRLKDLYQGSGPKVPPPSPTVRLAEMTQGRIESLERDKQYLRQKVDELQSEVARLGPENARLAESLHHARSNGLISSILIALGGGTIGIAAFLPAPSQQVAPVIRR